MQAPTVSIGPSIGQQPAQSYPYWLGGDEAQGKRGPGAQCHSQFVAGVSGATEHLRYLACRSAEGRGHGLSDDIDVARN